MARRRRAHKQPSPEFVKELAEAIGRVMIAASQIEHFIGVALAEMFRLKRIQHRAFVIPMSITSKSTLLRQLGKEYLNPEERKKLKLILDEFKECADIRNELAHGFYGAKKGKFALITHSGEGRFSGTSVAWTPNVLLKLVHRMVAARESVKTMIDMFPRPLKLPRNRKTIVEFAET